MRKLFQSFDRHNVDYLLISGQASVLYGAATFSEDLDLWVAPASANVARLRKALVAVGAAWYKLTPPLTRRYMLAGHGFHFIVPARPLRIYLDVLGHPPRVGGFGEARKRSSKIASEWGRVPVVAIEDLVEMKKTKRLSDYEVITNLAQIRVDGAPGDPGVVAWAAKNCFRAEDRLALLEGLGKKTNIESCGKRIAREIRIMQRRDAEYWARRVSALRRLRKAGLLETEGELVGMK